MTTLSHGTGDDAHGGHDHDHPKFLAHHFDTPQQQYDSGKLGTWLFLTTEILLFSGLFCAYSVYRATHPEVFEFAHLYLNKTLGAINTIVLIFSSFTMAWGVRAAQLGQKKLVTILLSITILCGVGFMCIKAVEYKTKFQEYLFPGAAYNPKELPHADEVQEKLNEKMAVNANTEAGLVPATEAAAVDKMKTPAAAIERSANGYLVEQSAVARASQGPSGLNTDWLAQENARDSHESFKAPKEIRPEPNNAQVFFSIYFLMTGLHGIHVLAGMGLIIWIILRNQKGEFGPEYFSPVDFVGLYWHIVDLVWIFLFPLLYLIS